MISACVHLTPSYLDLQYALGGRGEEKTQIHSCIVRKFGRKFMPVLTVDQILSHTPAKFSLGFRISV